MHPILSNDRLKAFFRSVCIIVLFGLILLLSNHTYWLPMSMAALFFSVWRKYRNLKLIIINIVFWFGYDAFFHFKKYHYPSEELNILQLIVPDQADALLFTKLVTFAGLILLSAIAYFYSKYLKKTSGIIYLTAILGVLFYTKSLLAEGTVYYIINMLLILMFLKTFWFLCFYLTKLQHEKFSISETLRFAINPFWTFGFFRAVGFSKGIAEFESSYQENDLEFEKSQMSGLKLAIWSLVGQALAFWLNYFFYENQPVLVLANIQLPGFQLPNPYDLGFSRYMTMNISFLERWFTVLLKTLIYILHELVGNAGMIVAFLRIIGFRVPRTVYKPYLAQNLLEFMQRIYFYYNYILTHYFFIPLYELFIKLKLNRALGLGMAVFLSIVLGGIYLSFIRGTYFLATMDMPKIVSMHQNRMLYFVGLATTVTVTLAYKRFSGKSTNQIQKYSVIKFLTAYCIYSLFYSLQGRPTSGNLNERWDFLLFLFKLK